MLHTTFDDPDEGWWRQVFTEAEGIELQKRFTTIIEEEEENAERTITFTLEIPWAKLVDVINSWGEVDVSDNPWAENLHELVGRALTDAYMNDPDIPYDPGASQMFGVWHWPDEQDGDDIEYDDETDDDDDD